MLSIALDKSRAVLIGMSEFSRDPGNLPPLPAVKMNVEDLAKIISDPNIIGIPDKNIVKILDEPKASDVQEKLAQACREAMDTLIVYYAGHGLIGKNSSELFLASADTTESDAEFNGIPFSRVKAAVADSSAIKKILVLDSCFSGRALQVMGSESSLLKAKLDLKGTFAMASAPSNEPAKAPEGEKYTSFSGELIKTLNNGIENNKREITLGDIYENIRNEFRRRPGMPEPQQANLQDVQSMVFAKNRAFSLTKDQQLKALEKKFMQQLGEQDKRIEELTNLVANIQPNLHENKAEIPTSIMMSKIIKLGLFFLIAVLPASVILFGERFSEVVLFMESYTAVPAVGVFLLVVEILILIGLLRCNRPRWRWIRAVIPYWLARTVLRSAIAGIVLLVVTLIPRLIFLFRKY
ncbi:MAG: caspase family protein [Planctomycetota bacterium]|jgi:hypothetical protein